MRSVKKGPSVSASKPSPGQRDPDVPLTAYTKIAYEENAVLLEMLDLSTDDTEDAVADTNPGGTG